MLRSTKLLPLCKGARNWIVAGTVYGPKATTDANNADDNRRSDEASDNRNYHRGKPFSRSQQEFKKHSPAADKEFHTHSSETSAATYAARDAAFRQKGFRAVAGEEGLASVGRYSAYKTRVPSTKTKKETVSESVSQTSAAEGRSSSPEVAAKLSSNVEQEDTRSSYDSGAVSDLQFSSSSSDLSSEPSSQPTFPKVSSFGDLLDKPDLNDLRKDSSANLETCTGSKVFCEPAFQELQKDVISIDSGSNRACLSADSPEFVREAGISNFQQQQQNLQSDLTTSTTSTTTTTTTSTTLSSSCQKKQPQGRHGNHRNRSNNSDSHRLVARVCNILNQYGWGEDAVRALDGLNTNLNAYQVNEILKQQKEAGLAYSFFIWARQQAGFKHDVHTYTTMLGILGRAKSFEVLNGLLGEMVSEGCKPNVVTYNRLIHCYGRANDLESSLKLFSVMQMVGCEPDRVTYCTLIDLQAKAGFHDSAMDLYRQMQNAGFKPDTFTYSIIIHCLGKAGKLNAAYKLFCEMTERGFAPSLVTYNIIIDLHAKAGKFDMALKLYGNLQEVGYSPDRVTYGIIMEVLGNCGHIEDAEHVFEEMVRSGWVADNPIFGLMVDMWGKTGNAEKAAEWFNRMLDSGLQPNVPACNSLLSAYLRACFYDAAAQVLRSMSKWGLLPTLQTYTSLLSSCAGCRAQWDYEMVFALMNCTGHPAHPFLCSLLSQRMEVLPIRLFFEAMQFEELESRRGFADSLIDFLHKAGKVQAAGNVWEVAAEKNLYPYAVKEKAPNYWSINLHVMSMGTALVVLSKTLAAFREAAYRTGAAPHRIDIITGWGRRSRVPGASLVKQAVEEMLRALQSPFFLDGSNVGCFVGQGQALMDWLKKPQLEQQVLQFA